MDSSSLNARRERLVQHPVEEKAVAFWVQCQHRGVILTGDLIFAKAQRFAESLGIPDDAIKFSNGWQRHKLRAIHGESGLIDVEALNEALPELKTVIAGNSLRDVYYVDETGKFGFIFVSDGLPLLNPAFTGLFYSTTPDTTIAPAEVERHKKDKVI